MSGQTTVPNYRETLFEYPDLSSMHGEPTYETLRVLTNQLKANARSVHTTLGGGQHGHLGLVLTQAQYAILSPTPYIRQPRPPRLEIPAYQLPHVVQTEQARYNEALRLFNECNNVEQALRQQIIKAVDDLYLMALRNRQTNTIDVTIPVILDYLFTNHGRVTPAMLHHGEKQVKEMYYDPQHPVDVIFNKVEDLLDLSIAARADFTEQQLINIVYVLLTATSKYQHYIREWSRLDPEEKTWTNFKTYFRRAHQELKESGDLQIKDTTFHSANLVQEVVDGVQTALQSSDNSIEDPSTVINQMANNAAQQQILPQMMAQMVQMMEQMNTLQQKLQNNSNPPATTPTNNPRRRRRTNFTFYCWSHGACAHPSHECKSKRPGHQDQATFQNKMGGSTAYCQLVTT